MKSKDWNYETGVVHGYMLTLAFVAVVKLIASFF